MATITGTSAIDTLLGTAGNDIIDGLAGADTMIGGLGNDTYYVDNVGDVVIENAGEGVDTVYSTVSYTLGANVEQLILTGAGAINGYGNDLDNVFYGNGAYGISSAGANQFFGGLGNDTYYLGAGDTAIELAGEGIDTVVTGSYTLGDNIENLYSSSRTANVIAIGNALNNVITAKGNYSYWLGGNDVIDGGAGADTMSAGLGNDTYYVDNAGDVVIENAGEGTDTIISGISYSLAANVENMTLAGAGLTATGNALDNSYTINNTGNSIVEGVNGGTDTVYSTVSYTLDANVEQLILIGAGAINGYGNDLDNVFYGNGAYGISSAGANQFFGGLGNDTYYLGAGDTAIELAGEGIDTVVTGSYTLGDNIENLYSSSRTANVVAIGNALNNVIAANGNYSYWLGGDDVIDGGAGADTMSAGLGNDTYYVDNVGDVVIENAGEGIDTVVTGLSSYSLGANIENLTMVGSGIIATGNALDNSYTINNTGNSIVEGVNGGTDTVYSTVSYTLDANVERLVLTGAGAINGYGNDLDNVFYGNGAYGISNTGANQFFGGLGNDTYYVMDSGDAVVELAGEGVDTVVVGHVVMGDYSTDTTYVNFFKNEILTYTLSANVENLTLHTYLVNGFSYKGYGVGNELDNVLIVENSTNNDVLDGGAGADTMSAGGGNDTYYVDNVNDVVIEYAGAETGTDTIYSSVSYTVSANVENMMLTGTDNINATGNELNNVLTGNSGNNLLNGGAGADTLSGGLGNDILQGGDGDDTLTDTAGSNLLNGGVGVDVLTGNAGNELFVGGSGNDTISTGDGADILAFNRGDGMDVVNGGVGTDNTLTLGGGINYNDLALTRSGNNLVLEVGSSEQITLSNWYNTAANYKSVLNLQVMADAMAGFDANSIDPLLNKAVQNFDFNAVVSAFDQASGGSTTFAHWSATGSLLAAHLSGSDTEALGGDLAHQYGKLGSYTGMNLAAAQSVLNAPQFAAQAQTLSPLAGLQGGAVTL